MSFGSGFGRVRSFVLGAGVGALLAAGTTVVAADGSEADLHERIEAFGRATIMAIGSLAVDTESNARSIADLRAQVADLRRELAEARK